MTTVYADGSTLVEQFNLDGFAGELSVTGSAIRNAFEAYDEGVDEPAGDTWSETSTDGGQDFTKTFTNLLGQAYQTQESGPNGATETSTTLFDGSDRPYKTTNFDGTIDFTNYDPSTGQVAATWQDILATGIFKPGVDPKTLASANAGQHG